MRLVTWNINGLGSLHFPFNIHAHHTHVYPQPGSHAKPSAIPAHSDDAEAAEATVSPFSPDFPPFPSSRLVLPRQLIHDYEGLLHYFQGDVMCMQEVKISRSKLDLLAKAAFVAGYDSFFSFSRKRQGYSGVVTYTRIGTACPVAAEEGVTGTLPTIVSTLSAASTASAIPSSAFAPIGYTSTLLSTHVANELRELDSEGRCVITDHGAFLLFNVYVPNAGEERNDFKLRFLQLLQLRLHECITSGRQVVVVGDLNIAAARLDHCAPQHFMLDNGKTKVAFEESPSRKWWESNVTSTPQPGSSLLVDVLRARFPTQGHAYTCWNTLTGARGGNYGSRIDYVLVSPALMAAVTDCRLLSYVEGSDHCPVQSDFDVSKLPGWTCAEVAPAFASQWWVEFSGQQKKLSHFFVKQHGGEEKTPSEHDDGPVEVDLTSLLSPEVKLLSAGDRKRQLDSSFKPAAAQAKKRKLAEKGKPEGKSLLSYFAALAPKAAPPPSAPPAAASSTVIAAACPSSPASGSTVSSSDAASPSSPSQPSSSSVLSPSQAQSNADAFSRLFTQSSLSLVCSGHHLPCKLWRTNKKGQNCGRMFFCCALPPPDRCSFFRWESDARKDAQKKLRSNQQGQPDEGGNQDVSERLQNAEEAGS